MVEITDDYFIFFKKIIIIRLTKLKVLLFDQLSY